MLHLIGAQIAQRNNLSPKIVNGIAPNHYVRAIREDTVRAKMLYLGTEHGIYVSFDDGANWQSLQLNLPDTSIQGIQVADRDLVIATHGRSFYVLDNVEPLRQFTPAIAASAEPYIVVRRSIQYARSVNGRR